MVFLSCFWRRAVSWEVEGRGISLGNGRRGLLGFGKGSPYSGSDHLQHARVAHSPVATSPPGRLSRRRDPRSSWPPEQRPT